MKTLKMQYGSKIEFGVYKDELDKVVIIEMITDNIFPLKKKQVDKLIEWLKQAREEI